jgi:hypothetical protein
MLGRRFCIITLSLFLVTAIVSSSQGGNDEAAVRETIVEAYVKGIHINRDVEAVRKGFHPSFTMFIKKGEDVGTLSIDKWVKSIEKSKEEKPDGPSYKVTHEIPLVNVSGDAAVAKVMIYRDGELIYSDYMSLYRFEDGWKIVGKIYFSHKK